mgnify:CR=1 FL=1
MPSREGVQSETQMDDLDKTLEQLEGVKARPADLHRLRQKPLKEFTTEDLRIMIGQNEGLVFLVPLALERLREYPLTAGGSYAGDLLKSTLCLEPAFWKAHPDLRSLAAKIAAYAARLVEAQEDEAAKKVLVKAIRLFQASA